jgi:glycosyltransferase involved in cell wall biosynthesis
VIIDSLGLMLGNINLRKTVETMPTTSSRQEIGHYDISVVIPTHNRARTIKMAVMSVLDQTVRVREVIVVDDNSDDETLEILRQIDDPRLKVLRTSKRSGATAARNLGAKASVGHWIAFQDSDDYWFAHKLERQLECMQLNPLAVLCYCSFIQYYSGKAKLVPGPVVSRISGDVFQSLLKFSFVSTQTIVVKRTVFEQVGGFSEQMPRFQDWELVLRISKVGSFCFVQEPLVLAYDTPGNLTSNVKYGIEARMKILNFHQKEFAEYPELMANHFHEIGKSHRKLGDFREAAIFFWQAVQKQPQRSASWFWLIRSFAEAFIASLLSPRIR